MNGAEMPKWQCLKPRAKLIRISIFVWCIRMWGNIALIVQLSFDFGEEIDFFDGQMIFYSFLCINFVHFAHFFLSLSASLHFVTYLLAPIRTHIAHTHTRTHIQRWQTKRLLRAHTHTLTHIFARTHTSDCKHFENMKNVWKRAKYSLSLNSLAIYFRLHI